MSLFIKKYRREALIGLLLVAAIWWLYAPVRHYDFVNLDDSMNVYESLNIRAGITKESVKWALTTREDYWRPLTRLSHMLDVEWFGMDAGAHHRTNVLLHTANALLLFGILRRMTGSVWRSAFVAAAFALHPLRVESVAWITERKDVLSALFWMLTLWAYTAYVERPRVWRYLVVLLFFALGLMSKPMLITLPFALLLLDFWPLGRFGEYGSSGVWKCGLRPGGACAPEGGKGENLQNHGRQNHFSNLWNKSACKENDFAVNDCVKKGVWRLILEKIPLLALAFASLAWTVVAQHLTGVAVGFTKLPLPQRVGNALISYVDYLWLLLRPVNLAVMYSNIVVFTVWQVAGAAVLLILITAAVLWRTRRHPYLFSGWFWYAGTLLPTAGLVQVGEQRMADRFTYIPIIGILIIIAWGVPELLRRWRHGKRILPVCAAAALAACAWATSKQLPVWKNSKTLFEHALKAGHQSPTAYTNLGRVLADEGRTAEAMEYYRKALRLGPGFAEAHNNLGTLLAHAGRTLEAMEHYREALRLMPNYAEAHNNLGNVLSDEGRMAEAIEHYREVLKQRSDDIIALNNLGAALVAKGRLNEALGYFRTAVRLAPDSALARDNLRRVLAMQRQTITQLREVLAQHPDDVSALNNLAWWLATAPDGAVRYGAEAVQLAERAVRLSGGNNSALLDTLAAAYAEAGRFDEAVKTGERAAELARSSADQTQLQQIEAHLELYRQGRPCRQP